MQMQNSFSNLILGGGDVPKRRRLLYRLAKSAPQVLVEYVKDFSRYLKFSGTLDGTPAENLLARITATYHNIEKGLSLPQPRLGFGKENLTNLILAMQKYQRLYGPTHPILSSAHEVLATYARYHESRNYPDYPCKQEIQKMLAAAPQADVQMGGTRLVQRETIMNAVAPVSEEFFMQRHSVRAFSDREVDIADIEAAVRVAQKSPVVCNRQSGAVHIIADPELIKAALDLQMGARGFSQAVNKLLVVTVDLRNFWQAGERNQGWMDGGMFAMSLIYGLHLRGLGSCCLNWSKTNSQTQAMRELVGLQPWDSIIMLIAVGHIPEEVVVPFSSRKDPLLVTRVIKNWKK
ncbi:nitroreductase [Pseudoduganella sp. FT26W]|uniref:Nitroreductase n=2 Tax=Duganella aquatilis TaxID=2666082 RepID=A0A844DEN0_9BURK|nr:nitroreductase [Duganella aquatilis]